MSATGTQPARCSIMRTQQVQMLKRHISLSPTSQAAPVQPHHALLAAAAATEARTDPSDPPTHHALGPNVAGAPRNHKHTEYTSYTLHCMLYTTPVSPPNSPQGCITPSPPLQCGETRCFLLSLLCSEALNPSASFTSHTRVELAAVLLLLLKPQTHRA